MKAGQMAKCPIIMNQSRPNHYVGISSTRLEYELNRHLIAQSNIIGALNILFYFFTLFNNFDHVDFMSAACFGIRIKPVLYLVIGPL
jgi:hypothetical protein